MSGGSWDYFYLKLEEIAARLCYSNREDRQQLGNALKPFVKAMHDIEWVDSGDYGQDGDEGSIRLALSTLREPHVSRRPHLIAEQQRLQARLVAIDVELEVEP